MSANKKKQAKGAKAPEAAKTKNQAKKDKKTDDKEWLEEELKDVKVNSEQEEADKLMQKAAEQLEASQKEIQEWKDNYMRLHAEWDTYRRRTAEQREAEKASATEALVADVLPVLDDFERSINYAEENGEAGLLDGVKAVHSKLISVLEKNGTEVIDPQKAEEFNALEHQAVATVEDKEQFDESIASVMQKGYKMGKKVIRPAMVSVTTGGKERPKEKDSQSEEDK